MFTCGGRGGEVVLGVVDALVVWLAAAAVVPLFLLMAMAGGQGEFYAATSGLLLVWGMFERRGRRQDPKARIAAEFESARIRSELQRRDVAFRAAVLALFGSDKGST